MEELINYITKQLDSIEKCPVMFGGLEAVEAQYILLVELLFAYKTNNYNSITEKYTVFLRKHFKVGSKPLFEMVRTHKILIGYLKDFRNELQC